MMGRVTQGYVTGDLLFQLKLLRQVRCRNPNAWVHYHLERLVVGLAVHYQPYFIFARKHERALLCRRAGGEG